VNLVKDAGGDAVPEPGGRLSSGAREWSAVHGFGRSEPHYSRLEPRPNIQICVPQRRFPAEGPRLLGWPPGGEGEVCIIMKLYRLLQG
jgi:hypothetical protein